MSNIFTYELDERNLRVQLKSMQSQVKEDAFKKFEMFSAAQVAPKTKSRFQGIDIRMNRSVVLPAVFGIIIILFSFLLFNFITVKNQRVETVVEAVNVTVPDVKLSNMAISNAQSSKVATPTKQNNAASAAIQQIPEVTESPAVAADIAVVAASAENVNVLVPQIEITKPEVSDENTISAVDAAKAEAAIKQKRKKKKEEETLSSIKPTLVTHDEESSEIPNLSE